MTPERLKEIRGYTIANSVHSAVVWELMAGYDVAIIDAITSLRELGVDPALYWGVRALAELVTTPWLVNGPRGASRE